MDARNHKDRSYQIGLVLVILGGLALLSNLGLFAGMNHLVGAVLFAVLGGMALRHYQRRRRIGSLVGAFVLFGLAAATIAGALSGFFFLALIGVGFGAVYWADRERWWAIIPAGTLLSLAVVAGLSEVAPRYESGSVLFIGLAATFVVLYRLPGDPKRWAIYPALASLALAVLGLSIGGSWILPLALVGVGLYLLYRRNEENRAVGAPAAGAGALEVEQVAGGDAPAGAQPGAVESVGAAGGEAAGGEPGVGETAAAAETSAGSEDVQAAAGEASVVSQDARAAAGDAPGEADREGCEGPSEGEEGDEPRA